MKRRSMGRKRSGKLFHKTAKRVHPLNRPHHMRGGWRL
jgi:hypothetical protein